MMQRGKLAIGNSRAGTRGQTDPHDHYELLLLLSSLAPVLPLEKFGDDDFEYWILEVFRALLRLYL